jgi:NADPH2:quinone reductase
MAAPAQQPCYNCAMQAIQMTEPGAARDVLQLVELPDPALTADDQIQVQVLAAGVNPVDTKLRARGVFYPDAYPAILGCDGAGIVTDCGKAVTRFRPGDRVWFCHGGLGGAPGNYAQYTVLPAAAAELMPATLDFIRAAALPLALITAWEALFDRARLQDGQTVLVHAGAGGVGHVAIQLARSIGARVATTVSGPDKAAFVRQLGAGHVINYREQSFVDAVMEWTDGNGVDVVFDTVGGDTFSESLAAARVYGHVVTLLDPGAATGWKIARDRNLSISFTLMLTPMLTDLPAASRHQGEILQQCARLIDAGQLSVHVADTLPLARAAEAHERIETGHVQGKIVLLTVEQ